MVFVSLVLTTAVGLRLGSGKRIEQKALSNLAYNGERRCCCDADLGMAVSGMDHVQCKYVTPKRNGNCPRADLGRGQSQTHSVERFEGLMCTPYTEEGTADCTPIVGAGNGGAFELINILMGKVYAVMASTPGVYTQQEFDEWTPSKIKGYMKNTAGVRVTTFNASCLYASPSRDGTYFTKLSTYPSRPYKDLRYLELADICPSKYGMGFCGPEDCVDMAPVPGSVHIKYIAKCHKLVWSKGSSVTKLVDTAGGTYIQHAWDKKQGGSTARSELYPKGWEVKTEVLEEDLVLLPSHPASKGSLGGMDFEDYPCGYVLIGDAEGNGFHRISDGGFKPEEASWHQVMGGKCPSNIVRKLRFWD